MSLNAVKLQQVVKLADGTLRARCPACAESGQDKKGEHLRVDPDGRFGCCVHPGDREHRKRIFALAGERMRRTIAVKVAMAKGGESVQRGILGRLRSMVATVTKPDAPDGVREVETKFTEGRTPRTRGSKSAASVSGTKATDLFDREPLQRTGRTPFLNSRVYGEKEWDGNREETCMHKGFGEGVRGVRPCEAGVSGMWQPAEDWRRRHPTALRDGEGRPLPYLGLDGTLVIPFESDGRFHWWNGGQALQKTIEAVKHHFRDAEGKEHNGIGV